MFCTVTILSSADLRSLSIYFFAKIVFRKSTKMKNMCQLCSFNGNKNRIINDVVTIQRLFCNVIT